VIRKLQGWQAVFVTTSDRDRRPYDLIVFGATSFVGQIVVRHLVDRGDEGLSWAMAGRSASKLAQVATSTKSTAKQVVADAGNLEQMRALAKTTRVIASTVGPYALHGSNLVQACAEEGTDYVDLTGEPQWMRQMIDTHTIAATVSGARIVHSCGFDSIPSDMGVWYTQQQSNERLGEYCTRIGMRLAGARGGASGGTVASLMNVVTEVTKDRELREVLKNPYALAPAHLRTGPEQPNVMSPERDDLSGEWVAPFVMAGINTKVVHRSHALMERPWGEKFLYDEAMLTGKGPVGLAKASAVTGAMGGFMAATLVPPVRGLINRFVLPKPGEGPSSESQEKGYFDLRFFGETASGKRITVKVTGDRDPGYGSTSKMMVAAALTLPHIDRRTTPGGFWTPSTAMGQSLLDALISTAGLTFEVLS
jgi:short subunit dehydrogenase-like uncharacterized protein